MRWIKECKDGVTYQERGLHLSIFKNI